MRTQLPDFRPKSVVAKWLDGSRCDVRIHAFADDTRLYLRCFHDERRLPSCDWNGAIEEVWMSANRLKLNADKTELLWAGSKYSQPSLGSKGPPRENVKTLR